MNLTEFRKIPYWDEDDEIPLPGAGELVAVPIAGNKPELYMFDELGLFYFNECLAERM